MKNMNFKSKYDFNENWIKCFAQVCDFLRFAFHYRRFGIWKHVLQLVAELLDQSRRQTDNMPR